MVSAALIRNLIQGEKKSRERKNPEREKGWHTPLLKHKFHRQLVASQQKNWSGITLA